MSISSSSKGLKLIGKGAFSKCYQLTDSTVLIKSSCPVKEAMALGFFPNSELFPTIERLEYDEESTYTMAYYAKTASLKKALDTDQWAMYKELRRVFKAPLCSHPHANRYELWRKSFETLQPALAEIMIDALDGCTNYGLDICFEISPRNVAVKDGKLVLMDCFFMFDALQKVWARKAARRDGFYF